MPVPGKLFLSILLLTSSILLRVQAQQDIVLTSSEELCFGQTVTLTCTHPDPFQDTAKYLPLSIRFVENGEVLDFGEPVISRRFTLTRLSSTASTLSYTVTEDDHANRVVNSSCFLTLNGGGKDESNEIMINVNAIIRPPTIMSKPNSTSGLLQWRPSSSCSNYQHIFTLTWVRIGDGSTGTVSTEENRYDFTGMPRGEYTVSLKARVTNFNLSESQPVGVVFCWLVSQQNVPAAAAAEGTVSFTVLAAVSAVASLFLIIIMVLATILVGVLVRMRRRRREEGQERKRRDSREANVPPVPMTTNPSYAQVQHSTEKKIPLYGNL